MYVDLLRGTVVEVPGFESKARRLPEAELCFWLGVMAVFDNAEDLEYYNATLLEHARLRYKATAGAPPITCQILMENTQERVWHLAISLSYPHQNLPDI